MDSKATKKSKGILEIINHNQKKGFAEKNNLLVSTLNLIDYFTYSEKQTNKKERLSRIEFMIKILKEKKGELNG